MKKSSTPEGSQLVLPTSQFSTWINIQDRAQGAQGNILDLSRQYQVLTDSSCDEHDVSKETNGLFLRSHSESHISDFESEYRTQIKFKHKTNELAGEDLSST